MYNKQRNRMRRNKIQKLFYLFKGKQRGRKKTKILDKKLVCSKMIDLNMHILIITQGQMH